MNRDEFLKKVQERERSRMNFRSDFVPSKFDSRYKRDEAFGGFTYSNETNQTLKFRASVSRTGCMDYFHGKECRTQNEVFKKEHLESIKEIPITVGHPQKLLKHGGIAKIVGKVLEVYPSSDNTHIEVVGVIDDKETIDKILQNELSGFSMGYTSDDKEINGVIHHHNIIADHLAILPNTKVSRCGNSCNFKSLELITA